jgi:hypothetical protein
MNPSTAFSHHLLACVLEFSRESRESIDHIQTVLRLDPHYRFKAYALADLALSYLSLGEFEEPIVLPNMLFTSRLPMYGLYSGGFHA